MDLSLATLKILNMHTFSRCVTMATRSPSQASMPVGAEEATTYQHCTPHPATTCKPLGNTKACRLALALLCFLLEKLFGKHRLKAAVQTGPPPPPGASGARQKAFALLRLFVAQSLNNQHFASHPQRVTLLSLHPIAWSNRILPQWFSVACLHFAHAYSDSAAWSRKPLASLASLNKKQTVCTALLL